MIQANELRLGNLVLDGEEPIKIDIVSLRYMIDNKGIEIFRPIPLTEEWLLKFGFKYSKALTLFGHENGHTIFDNNADVEDEEAGYYIHFYHNGKYLIIESTNDHGEYSNLMFRNIKYVHQLQNIFFDFTGEELEAKL